MLEPPVVEGTYLFRYCSDAAEKLPTGRVNTELFVLSYMRDQKLLNTKIFRHFLGEKNPIGAGTTRGFVLSEHKEPRKAAHCHATIMGCTLSIIGQHAQELR